MKHAFKKTLAMLLVLVMVIGVIPSVFAAKVAPFTDVDEADWFAPFVKYVYEHDPQLMNGTSATTFEPEGTCTRAMAAVVLYRLADPVIPSIKPSTFTDLTEDWYKNGIAWAQQKGVVNGVGGNRFDPDGLVTREQLVTMLWRYAGSPKVEGDFLKGFPDANQVDDYAKEAFNWAISMKIIAGSDGKLLPKANATRAQFAKIISVFDEVTKPCEEHTWDAGKVTKEPTCTEEGEIVYTCTRCGETKTETLPATGHNYVDGVCTGCGDKLASKDEIVIYYTNDVHTYIDGALSYDNIADLKAQTASVAAGVLLLDAGDHVQGTAYGSMDKGKTIIEMMAAANYDAATLGNHEFDYGMERALEITKQAGFPYLSCNFYNEKNGVAGDSVLDAYKIFTVGGKKIAVVGITTPESFTKSTPKYFQDEAGNYIYGIAGGADGAALYASVQTAVNAAKAAGADYVIALGHCGDDPSSKPWTSEEVIANTTGIDAFIDGHSHSTVEMKEVKAKDGKTVVLTQTGSYFNAIGRMSITKDGIKSELIEAYNGSDKDVAAIKNAWIAEIDTKLGEVIGHTALTFDNYDRTDAANPIRLVRKQETNTGDFAADALYYLFDNMDLDVDLAIMNGGGVRNKAITGDISYKTCKEIHTFGNVACLITVTGQQILDALEWGARDVGTAECGGFLQVSGVTYEIHTYIPSTVQKDDKGVWTAGPTGEYRVKNVKIGGEPLDLTKTYNMAGYNYTLRDCGDGFAMFKGAANVLDYVMEDYMVLANYVKSFPTKNGKHEIEAANSVLGANYAEVTGEGRITIVPTKGETKDEFVLASGIKGGDEVVIYNPGHGMAIKNETDNDWYLMPETIAPTGNKIYSPDASLVWTVVDNGNGTFSFVNGENKIMMWLSEQDGKTYFELTNNASYEGATGEWKVISGDASSNLYYIQHSTLASSYGPAYIECYYNANKDVTKISGYTTSSPTAKDYGFQFYVKGAEAPDPDPDPDPTPDPAPEGYVAIFNPANSVVMTTEVSTYTSSSGTTKDQLKPAAATLADGKLTTTAENVALFKLETVDGVTTFKTEDGKYLYADGTNVRLADAESEYTRFVLEDTTGGQFIKCETAQYNGNPQYIEYYASKSVFSVFSMGTDTTLYTFAFYEIDNGETPTPDPDPTPDPVPEGYVAIFNPANSVVMTTEVSTYTSSSGTTKDQLKPAAATLADGKLTTTAENVALFKLETVDGVTTFKTEDGKYLYADGTNVRLADAESEYTRFVLEDTTGGQFIKCETAQYNGNPQYIEYYASKSVFSVFSMGTDTSIYTFAFYEVDNGEAPTPDPDPTPDPVPEGYVAIFNPANSVVMTTEVSTYTSSGGTTKDQLKPAAATLADGKLTTTAENVALFKLVTVDGVTTFKTEDGKYLYADGTNVRLADAESEYTRFVLEDTTGGQFIKCETAQYNGNPQYIEYYASKSVFSVFSMGSDASIYTFAFYELSNGEEACAHEWDDGVTTAATCTTAGKITYTCKLCGDVKTEEIAPLGHIDENNDDECDRCHADLSSAGGVATSIAAGDKIVITAKYNGVYYAAGNEINPANAIAAVQVDVTDGNLVIGDADVVWEVVAGTDGKYLLKGSKGQYMTYAGSGTGMKLDDTGYEYTITCGEGTSTIDMGYITSGTSSTHRLLGFRMSGTVPQFRAYAETNATGEYSRDITIWKIAD